MSRLLMATPSRLSHQIRPNQFNSLLNITRQMAKAPAKPAAKCGPKKPKQPKNGYFASGGTHALFSDLPKPEGDFYKAYKAKNSKYTMVMLSGILVMIGSVTLLTTSGMVNLYSDIPEYPYTEEELQDLELAEEQRQEMDEEREQRHQDLVEAKELKIRRRKAKEAMAREVELMQKDIDEGIDDGEMAELVQLAQEREEFESWEKEELKRQAEKEKERLNVKKEKEKARLAQQKQREKERKEREKAR